jgi:hypothetical protein
VRAISRYASPLGLAVASMAIAASVALCGGSALATAPRISGKRQVHEVSSATEATFKCGGLNYGPPGAQQDSHVSQIVATLVTCHRARAIVLKLLIGQWHHLSNTRVIDGFACRPVPPSKTFLAERCAHAPARILIYSDGDF